MIGEEIFTGGLILGLGGRSVTQLLSMVSVSMSRGHPRSEVSCFYF